MSFRSRELAHRMKRLRARTGQTAKQLAQQLGVSQSEISHIETGTRDAPDDLIIAYLTLCGLSHQETRAHLDMAREPHSGCGYWLAASAESIDILSSLAHHLFSYHPETVPALLAAESDEIRPAIVVDDDRHHTIVLHERTLQGSSTEQLLTTMFVAGFSNYSVHLVPEPHAFGPPFHLLSTNDGQSVVYVPGPYRGLCIDNPEGIHTYTEVRDDILGAALSAEETQDTLVRRIDHGSHYARQPVKIHSHIAPGGVTAPYTVTSSRLTSDTSSPPAPSGPGPNSADTPAARSSLAYFDIPALRTSPRWPTT